MFKLNYFPLLTNSNESNKSISFLKQVSSHLRQCSLLVSLDIYDDNDDDDDDCRQDE